MEIKYVGPMNAGTLADGARGGGYPFKKGVPIDVRDDLAEKVIAEQGHLWRKASGVKRKKVAEEGD